MPKPLHSQGFSHFWLWEISVGALRGRSEGTLARGPSPPHPLPKRAPLHRCHGTGQRPLPDRADAVGAGAPREVPTGFAGAQEVTKECTRGPLGSLPLQSASTSNAWVVGPYMLEPTQYQLNGSGPERSLSNGAGLGSQWRTVRARVSRAASASPGSGGQFPEAGSNPSEQGLITPPGIPGPT